MNQRESAGHGDLGFATVWVVTAMAVVAAAAAVAISIGVATVERHRAAVAADVVALDAALNAVRGSAVACNVGGALGRLDGASVTRCALDGPVAEVEVAVRLPGALGAFGPAIGRAKAGPASEVGSGSAEVGQR
jgi:secretion/DNA translocation related TadE-like protein